MILNYFLIPLLLSASYYDLKNKRHISAVACYDFVVMALLIWTVNTIINPVQGVINLGYAVVTLIVLYVTVKRGDLGDADVYYLTGISLVLTLYNGFMLILAVIMFYNHFIKRVKTPSPFIPWITLAFILTLILEAVA